MSLTAQSKISTWEGKIRVRFESREKDLADQHHRSLGPAYVLTIHKPQGSEFDFVIIRIVSTHDFMLQRNLLCTAVTTGKRKVNLVGELKAVQSGIRSTRRVL